MIGKEIADLWPLLLVLCGAGLAAWIWRRHVKGLIARGREQAEGDANEAQIEAEARRAAARRGRWNRQRLREWAKRRSRSSD